MKQASFNMTFPLEYLAASILLLSVQKLPESLAFSNGFTIVVEPGSRECFYEELARNQTIDVEYQVIEGGELDIDLHITGPNGEVVIMEQRKSDNMHSISAPVAGVYEYCFDNSFSTVARKTVFADLGVDTDDLEWKKHVEQDKFDDDSNIEDLVDTLDNIKNALEKTQNYQALMRAKHQQHSKLLNSNGNRVFWWSLVQSLAMIGVAIAQTRIVKSFFGTTRTGRV